MREGLVRCSWLATLGVILARRHAVVGVVLWQRRWGLVRAVARCDRIRRRRDCRLRGTRIRAAL
jgi:hypothetical protein